MSMWPKPDIVESNNINDQELKFNFLTHFFFRCSLMILPEKYRKTKAILMFQAGESEGMVGTKKEDLEEIS